MRTTGDCEPNQGQLTYQPTLKIPQGDAREMDLETSFWNRCFTMFVIQIPVTNQ